MLISLVADDSDKKDDDIVAADSDDYDVWINLMDWDVQACGVGDRNVAVLECSMYINLLAKKSNAYFLHKIHIVK